MATVNLVLSARWKPVFYCAAAILLIWIGAVVGLTIARNSRVTAEKVRAYISSVDLAKLSGEERANAIRRLEGMLNRLSYEERQRARFQRLAWGWFNEMTEEERAQFIEATMPSGFKQMITAFEQLPEDKRRRAIDDALRRLKESQSKAASDGEGEPPGTNRPPALSKELEAKVRSIGLQTFYSQSSAQTKAELAPVLEELQRVMESGRPLRR